MHKILPTALFLWGMVIAPSVAYCSETDSLISVLINSDDEITSVKDSAFDKSPLLSEEKDSLHFNLAPVPTRKISISQDSIPSRIESDNEEPSFEIAWILKSENSYNNKMDSTKLTFTSTKKLSLADSLYVAHLALLDSKVQPFGRKSYVLLVSKTKENELDYQVKNETEEPCLESCVIL